MGEREPNYESSAVLDIILTIPPINVTLAAVLTSTNQVTSMRICQKLVESRDGSTPRSFSLGVISWRVLDALFANGRASEHSPFPVFCESQVIIIGPVLLPSSSPYLRLVWPI